MAQRVKLSNAQKEEKAKNRAAANKRRADNLALRSKAKEEATAAGLPFNESIPAAQFAKDYAAAYKVATTPAVDPNDVVAGVNQNPEAEPPKKRLSNEEMKAIAPVVPKAEVDPTDIDDGKDIPLPKSILGTSAGEAVVYDSTNDQVISPAEASAAVFAANENAAAERLEKAGTDDQKIDDALVEESNAADAAKVADPMQRQPGESNRKYKDRMFRLKQKAAAAATQDAPTEVPLEEPAPTPVVEPEATPAETPAPTETPAPVETPTETPATEMPAQDVPEETKPVEQPVVEEAKPTEAKTGPKLVSFNPNIKAEDIEAARKFYGSAWTDERAPKLADAYRSLTMAIRAEAKNKTLADAALRNALAHEAAAFGNSPAVAMAA